MASPVVVMSPDVVMPDEAVKVTVPSDVMSPDAAIVSASAVNDSEPSGVVPPSASEIATSPTVPDRSVRSNPPSTVPPSARFAPEGSSPLFVVSSTVSAVSVIAPVPRFITSPDVRTLPATRVAWFAVRVTPPPNSVTSEEESPSVTSPVFRKSTCDVNRLSPPNRLSV